MSKTPADIVGEKNEESAIEISGNQKTIPVVKASPKMEVPFNVIDVESSSESSYSDSDDEEDAVSALKGGSASSLISTGVLLTPLTTDPLPISVAEPVSTVEPVTKTEPTFRPANGASSERSFKQFWKAGDYDFGEANSNHDTSVRMDHARVHPKFLHSNATSHKWALGAFAELLDNAIDEVHNGATYVSVDVIDSKKDGSKMLLIEDDGGGMNPANIRHCMSLGFSAKSKSANTIGQYGNGFKTSTMRLGADVIVFSRCHRRDGKNATQSIGLLSYTFLRSTGKEDIFVPLVDFEKHGMEWKKMLRSTAEDWNQNLETLTKWSPFPSEKDLLFQFNQMTDHGTKIIIYNLWEDDQGCLELDFTADLHDIHLRGINRDEKKIQMAKEFPNSRHFLTYQHSLRSYASILYLRYPPGFRIILRGRDVYHHNIVDDMMLSQEITYKPQINSDGIFNVNITAVVTIGFVKDAKHHIDVQGFNVYHKNRLIKPFWRLWNPAGSDGRGVIGVLEANFVEPAHDKQGFERTTILGRLETRLVQMQKQYWSSHCHFIGYTARKKKMVEKRFPFTEYPESSPSGSKRTRYSPSEAGGMQLVQYEQPSFEEEISFSTPPPLIINSNPTVRGSSSNSHGRNAQGDSLPVNSESTESDPSAKSSPPNRNSNRSSVKKEMEELEKSNEKNVGPNCVKCEILKSQMTCCQRENEELRKEINNLLIKISEQNKNKNEEVEIMRKKYKDASGIIQQLLDKLQMYEGTPKK